MKVEHLTSADEQSFKDISFEVCKGEIFGVGGLVGAQRSELMESIFGLHKAVSGKIIVDGKEITVKEPMDAISHGMALLTEDRRKTGIIGPMSITDNVMVVAQNTNLAEYTNHRMISNEKRNQAAQKYVDALDIKMPSLKTKIETLSGGNQQKVLLGRWMLTGPDILILDEPTRGIDVGAKYEIYELMESMANQGKCVIMISSEMPELMGMSDRIMVMCEGRVSGFLNASEATDEKIMYLASTYKKGDDRDE